MPKVAPLSSSRYVAQHVMSTARHHHYIPQFYLAGFTDSGEKDGRISVLDLAQERQWTTSVRAAGAERDFNRVDIPGVEIDAVEKALSPFEGKVASVLKKLHTTRELPELNDLFLLLEFVALLAVRNKATRNALGDAQEKMLWLLLQQLLAHPERWDQQRENLRRQGFPLLPDLSLEEAQELVETREFKYSPPTTEHVLREMKSVNDVAGMLRSRNWTLFCTAQETRGFICSDRPVACVWDIVMPPGMRAPGFMESGSEITVPLSSQMALYGTFGGPTTTAEASEDIVGEINTRTVSASDRFVYSAHQDFICRGVDGTVTQAANLLLDPPDLNLNGFGKQLVFFTDKGKSWLQVTSYERDNSNPLKPVVRLWTQNLDRLFRIADCNAVEVVYFFEDGQERGGTRNLRFTAVSLLPDEPSVIEAAW